MKTIVLTGGGTAGHIMPNLALIPELSKHFEKIVYIGGNGMEKTLVPKYNIPFYETDTVKFSRSKPLSNIKIPFILPKSVGEAKKILKEIKTDVVFGKGGYAAMPSCYAAKSLDIPVVIHESDFTLGLANKLIGRFSVKTLTSFPETKDGIYTGNPVRAEIFTGNAERARIKYKLDSRPVILVFGGSLGSESINNSVYGVIPAFSKTHNIVHITGKHYKPLNTSGYIQTEYADDINDLYAVSDAVVMRGGANSLCEATALGKRTLSVPLPKSGSRGDQEDNAESYRKRGLIDVLPQSLLNSDSLEAAIRELLKKPAPKPLGNTANAKIVGEILSALG